MLESDQHVLGLPDIRDFENGGWYVWLSAGQYESMCSWDLKGYAFVMEVRDQAHRPTMRVTVRDHQHHLLVASDGELYPLPDAVSWMFEQAQTHLKQKLGDDQ